MCPFPSTTIKSLIDNLYNTLQCLFLINTGKAWWKQWNHALPTFTKSASSIEQVLIYQYHPMICYTLYTWMVSPQCGWACATLGFHFSEMTRRIWHICIALLPCGWADVSWDFHNHWMSCCTVHTWMVSPQCGFSCASSNCWYYQMIFHTGHSCAISL